ncbi:hypothetical protein PPYR_01509 [Photinus pyralis]|uniref:Uncharacterized protein n=2 Tax=Photinus pyralis TaxID=7054 RepID=A0A5N4B4J1_PHOPY|nr:uncharacterized protein LOC116175115 [Photinus pyralis]KAB0804539.1 hypothetical protein PPYR_01509 [Photinus pyralis]
MDYKIILTITTCVALHSVQCMEIPSNCSKSDNRCLQKREEMHWCTDQGCSTCTDHNCLMTCKGFNCGICPKGDCCNGTNCNVCYNNSCCATESCNYCIRTCNLACTNYTLCEKVCISKCHKSDKTVFVVPSALHGNHVTVYIRGTPYKGDLTSRPFSSQDKTAIVLIDGVDHIAMVLSLPQRTCKETKCDSTCKGEHCNGECMKDCLSKCSKDCNRFCLAQCSKSSPNKAFNYYDTLTPGCCHVVHPLICHNSPFFGQSYCSRKSHRECSAICTSKFIHIGPRHGQLRQHIHCYYIQAYPYIYCGNYVIQNCDSCYVCNGSYNPSECVKSVLCSNICRENFLPFKPTAPKKEAAPPPMSVPRYIPNPYLHPFGYSYYNPNQLFSGPQQYG